MLGLAFTAATFSCHLLVGLSETGEEKLNIMHMGHWTIKIKQDVRLRQINLTDLNRETTVETER